MEDRAQLLWICLHKFIVINTHVEYFIYFLTFYFPIGKFDRLIKLDESYVFIIMWYRRKLAKS